MRGRLLGVLAALGICASSFGVGEHPLLREVQQHLDLAHRCANAGQVESAFAHASVVSPDHRLRVRIDCQEIPAPAQGLYRNAVAGAFRLWESALGEKLFEVSETGHPDLVIHFQPNVSDKGIEVCGHSQWTRGVLSPDSNPTVVLTADVMVRMLKPGGEALDYYQLRACAAHELGHVLGLDDSPTTGDVMGKMDFSHPVLTIRPDEVAQLIVARQEAASIRRSFSSRATKFKE